MNGHRQYLTEIQINEIKAGGAKAAAKKEAAPKAEAKEVAPKAEKVEEPKSEE